MDSHALTDEAFDAILTEAIARTGVQRYRYLCLDYPDEKIREQYRGLVTQIAAGTYTGQYHPVVRALAEFDPDFVLVSGCGC